MKDGGQAFPRAATQLIGPSGLGAGKVREVDGMTLRDYFAAAALTGLCANRDSSGVAGNVLASLAYNYADRMIEVRSE